MSTLDIILALGGVAEAIWQCLLVRQPSDVAPAIFSLWLALLGALVVWRR